MSVYQTELNEVWRNLRFFFNNNKNLPLSYDSTRSLRNFILQSDDAPTVDVNARQLAVQLVVPLNLEDNECINCVRSL